MHAPDLNTSRDVVRMVQTYIKLQQRAPRRFSMRSSTISRNTRDTMRRSTAIAQQNVNMGKEARAAHRVIGTEIIREIKNKGLQS